MARYRLIEPLGHGGMADVHLAEDLQLGRQVALKFLSAAFASDASAHLRLQREAQSAAALDHPCICKIFEIGQLGGRPFIAMEYVRGRTLRARLDEGPLLADEVRSTALAVADALHDAHRHGIVHRDLKPANIMLADQGHVKVMDFGLARRVAAPDPDSPTMAGITEAGMRLGTPAYMSPEQVLGGVVDRPSDVFSFGIVLAEMLTAVHPFAKVTAAETMGAIVREAPVLADALRGSLRALVERTLAKDVRQRPDIADVVESLRNASTWPTPSPPSRQRANGERRVATVLVVGAIAESGTLRNADDEAAIDNLRVAVTVLEEQALRHEGTVTERRDDGLVVMFGAPVSLEDSVQLAVQAALAMRDALRVLGLDVRAGLHTGPVAVEGTGIGRVRITALGDTARVAARLEARADAGDVLVSARTALAIAPYYECTALDGDPDASCRIVRGSGVRARFDISSQRGLSTFVGRDGELAMLGRAFERAREGEGQIVLLSGEPGIGKSRLVTEFQRIVTGDSSTWLDAACTATGRGTPYQAIATLLRHAFGVTNSDDASRILLRIDEETAAWQEAAKRTVPFLKTVLNVDAGDSSLSLMDPAEHRLGIHAGLAALFSERARQGPVVVAIDDLHWMDGPSEDALAAASDLVASLPLLLVLTVRPGHAGRLGERSFIHRVSMSALGPAEGHALVHSLLADQPPSDDIARLVVARAGGNPLYVEEVTRTLVETGAIRSMAEGHVPDTPADGVLVPDSIGQVILARIDRLPVAARDVLQRAAVIGRDFSARVLHQLPLDSAGLDASLEILKAQEFIREKSRFPELTYVFRHALVHEVAYSTLLTGRRRELHRGVADTVERLHADRLADYCEVIAHHTVEGQDWERAVEYLDRAAERAAGLFSNDEAVDFYARAIAACHEVGDSALGRAIDLSRRRAELLTNLNRLGDALATLKDMRALAVRAGDRHAEAVASALEGWTHGWGHDLAASERASKAALQLVGSEDDEVRFLASGSLALFLYGHHRVDDAGSYLRMSEDLAPRVDDPYRQGLWGMTGWHQRNWEGRFDDVFDHLERWRPAADRSRNRFVVLGNQWCEAAARAGKGEYSRALAILDEVLKTCDRVGHVFFSIRTVNMIGWIYSELQDHERALEWNRRGVHVALEANEGYPEVECNARLNVGDNLMALGRLDEAAAEFQYVERIVRDPRPHQVLDLWRYAQHMFHAYGELWLIRGDVDRALRYADECLALAEPANHRKNVAKGRRLRGEARLAQSRLDDADAELARALSAAERVGNPPQLWKTLAAIGDLRRAQGRDGDARQSFLRALDVIDTVARGLDDVALRDTFLTSAHVQSIRRRAMR